LILQSQIPRYNPFARDDTTGHITNGLSLIPIATADKTGHNTKKLILIPLLQMVLKATTPSDSLIPLPQMVLKATIPSSSNEECAEATKNKN
jgi:hypothetical protein